MGVQKPQRESSPALPVAKSITCITQQKAYFTYPPQKKLLAQQQPSQ